MMESEKIYYKRNLPHYQPKGYTFFVTFRLSGSLPKYIIEELKQDYKNKLQSISAIKIQKEKKIKYSDIKWDYFEMVDLQLNLLNNNLWLKDEHIAAIVSDSIKFHDKKEYDLICYCIMPNHVHLVFTLVERAASSLYKIMHSLKSYTSNECNKILKRTG
jgi:putative transposase